MIAFFRFCQYSIIAVNTERPSCTSYRLCYCSWPSLSLSQMETATTTTSVTDYRYQSSYRNNKIQFSDDPSVVSVWQLRVLRCFFCEIFKLFQTICVQYTYMCSKYNISIVSVENTTTEMTSGVIFTRFHCYRAKLAEISRSCSSYRSAIRSTRSRWAGGRLWCGWVCTAWWLTTPRRPVITS